MKRQENSGLQARPVTVAMHRMLVIASMLVFIAGFQLFILTERTGQYFAWTIGFPLSAGFSGCPSASLALVRSRAIASTTIQSIGT
jgi:hypothetical protein